MWFVDVVKDIMITAVMSLVGFKIFISDLFIHKAMPIYMPPQMSGMGGGQPFPNSA